ncbi:MAG: type IV pilus twitching motility protein PilT [Planctomycetes bacterium]|nr:type IV pilus twitching motility protein PilT [Planctomycetota bacterium]MCC7170874.1 type IV pilus twitching motility protein PilT [Planctomycetota bacterium]
MPNMQELLQLLVHRNGSDLHITAGSPPRIRISGALLPMDYPVMSAEETKALVYSILTTDQVASFEKNIELDFSFGIRDLGRFRTNVFMQRGAVGAVLRVIPYRVLTFDDLGLPTKVCEHICNLPRGLVLVTGATGSGKSTTLAAMIDYINETQPVHIMTIEDPIEFLHSNKTALVNQREVGSDTLGFKNSLRSILRQDPDCVLIGEMRDLETIEAALLLSETGHLTFGTLHTSDAVQTINRIIDVFPHHQQQQIRTQLSFCLQAVFCQQLVPVASGKGRAMAAEILLVNQPVRALVRDDKAHQIYSIIQTSKKIGMQTMNTSLSEHVLANRITVEEALARSSDPDELKRLIHRS